MLAFTSEMIELATEVVAGEDGFGPASATYSALAVASLDCADVTSSSRCGKHCQLSKLHLKTLHCSSHCSLLNIAAVHPAGKQLLSVTTAPLLPLPSSLPPVVVGGGSGVVAMLEMMLGVRSGLVEMVELGVEVIVAVVLVAGIVCVVLGMVLSVRSN